jgi:glycosyltransferase involved in cell wall biosynthesis
MKIAIVHEWFASIAGSERVVEQILALYPTADVFCVYADPAVVASTDFLKSRTVRTTFIQNLPRARKSFRAYLSLMPLAIEQVDLTGYELVISSAHAVSKGVLTGPDQLHVSYVHSPIRYAWDMQHQYLRESGLDRGLKGWIAKWMLHKMRIWDYRTAAGVDHFIANSRFIARRVKKVYGRDADVIHPPVDVQAFELCETKQDHFLTASRLVSYKRIDLIVQAFARMPGKRLVVIGDGPEMARIGALATSNVELLGYQEFAELKRHMQQAKAFVFAAEEDFGIIPVEAQACGTPVIAFGKGGALETVVESADASLATGLFFHEQSVESIIDAVERFDARPVAFSPSACRANAERFSIELFRNRFSGYVDEKLRVFRASLATVGSQG